MNVIRFDSEISIKNIKLFMDSIIHGLKNSEEELIIDFLNQKRTDLAVMQVLIAAHYEAKVLKKKIRLINVSVNIRKRLSTCGFHKTAL